MADLIPAAQDEVVGLCRDLLRIDSSNFGDDSGPGERQAAEYVATQLSDVGLEVQVLEKTPGRTNLVTRLPGADPSRPALLVHGHLDVVPAQAEDWQVPPFAGEERDGCLWGRGAVDMKDMDAMILASVRHLARANIRPARDLVICFTADEEAGGVHGARWLADEHGALFEGCSEAISEVGGFSVPIGDRRAYLLQTAEKGIAWIKLTAHGTAGHGSQINPDNAVTRLARAVAAIGSYTWPRRATPTLEALTDGLRTEFGLNIDINDQAGLQAALGDTAKWVGATLQNTSNPSVLSAGYKHNVIPGHASALIDCRYLPGDRDEVLAVIADLAGEGVQIEIVQEDIALEWPHTGPLIDAMKASVRTEDPDAVFLPYCLSGGTDNKSFSRLGITGYGFAPLRLPAELNFAGMFHGVDERVPVESLKFGTRVLEHFLQNC